MKRVEEILEGEVKVYDQWLTGEGYYLVAEDAEGNRLDSVGGILGDDGRDDVISEMKITIDNYVKNSAVAAAI